MKYSDITDGPYWIESPFTKVYYHIHFFCILLFGLGLVLVAVLCLIFLSFFFFFCFVLFFVLLEYTISPRIRRVKPAQMTAPFDHWYVFVWFACSCTSSLRRWISLSHSWLSVQALSSININPRWQCLMVWPGISLLGVIKLFLGRVVYQSYQRPIVLCRCVSSNWSLFF